jgi:hypothetical protein
MIKKTGENYKMANQEEGLTNMNSQSCIPKTDTLKMQKKIFFSHTQQHKQPHT